MTDVQVQCFLLSCQTLNFTRTAEMMNYAPQAVSKMIVSLETELRTQLFLRENGGHTLSMTAAGQYYMDLLTKDKGKKDRTMGEIFGWYRWLVGHFRLGISAYIDPLGKELTDTLVNFQREQPNLEFTAAAYDNETLHAELSAGHLDAVILSRDHAALGREFGMTPIARERPCLVVPKRICGTDPETQLDPECWGVPFVQRPVRDWGIGEFDQITRKDLAERGIFPKEVRMMPTVMSVNTALMIMDCVTIADRRFGNVTRLPKVRYFDLPDTPQPSVLCCMWSFHNENPRLIDFIESAWRSLGDYLPEWEELLPENVMGWN